MRNDSGHQCKVKMSGSEKKSEQERVGHFLQRSFWKFHVAVMQNNAGAPNEDMVQNHLT